MKKKTETIRYEWKPNKGKDDKKAWMVLSYDMAKTTEKGTFVNTVSVNDKTLLLQGMSFDENGYRESHIFLSNEALVKLVPLIQKHLKRAKKDS